MSIVCEQCGAQAQKRPGGRFCSRRCSVKWQHAQGLSRQVSGSEHYAWKDRLDKYGSIHMRINRVRGRASGCSLRETAGCTSEKYEWAHIHGTDPQDIQNYMQLCKSCHIVYDGQAGAGHTNAKLTMEQAQEIRRRYAAGGVSQQALADEFNVHQGTVSGIIRNKTYVLQEGHHACTP